MKVLYIGGTGTISTSCVLESINLGHDVYVLNRGNRNNNLPSGVKIIKADIRNETETAKALKGIAFDSVCDFISFTTEHVRTALNVIPIDAQYIFISTASAYQKPTASLPITEATPLANPYWQYSRDKIACEDLLVASHRETGRKITIVRPSHTYCEKTLPLCLHGDKGSWQILKRMTEGKPVPVVGDGLSLWTVTHARDFAKAFTRLIGNVHAFGGAYHLTSDEFLTWNAIYDIIGRELGVKPNLLHLPAWILIKRGEKYGYDFTGALLGDKSNCALFDNSAIKKVTGWKGADIRFDEGVCASINMFKNCEELQTVDSVFDEYCNELCEMYGA